MTDEILIRMGLDVSAVHRGLRGMKAPFQQLKSDFLAAGGAGGALAGALAVTGAMFVKFGRDALQYASDIDAISESTGLSAETVQAFGLRVSYSTGKLEDGQKALRKFAAAMSEAGKDPEKELAALMDRVENAVDPMNQLAIATEVFGDKLGVKVVGALRGGTAAFEEFKKANSGSILSKEEVSRLDIIGDRWDSLIAKARTYAGKLIAGATSPLTDSAQLNKNLADQRAAIAAERAPKQDTPENTKKLATALEKLDKARRDSDFSSVSESKKAELLAREKLKLERQLADAKDGTLEKVKLQTELVEKEKDLREQIEKAEKESKDFQTKKLSDQEKLNEAKERERTTLRGINEAEKDRWTSEGKVVQTKKERSKFTLGELANTNIDRMTTGPMRQEILKARRVQWLEGQAENLANHGYDKRSQEVFDMADKLRSGLTSLTESERAPYAELEKTAREQAASLKELLKRASADGIVVVPAK